jgi:beta-phosphoglucomutase
MDGASDLIAALHAAGFKLAIGSSGPPENVELVRRTIRHGELLSAAVSGKDVTRGKPDPEVFLTAAKKLEIEPTRCAVVEDAPVGVEAARRAGMAAIGLTGTAPREALAKHAHLVVDSLRELNPAMIASLIETKD